MKTARRVFVAVKVMLSRYFLLVEFCKECGRRQPVIWTATPALWAELVDETGGGVLCPECFNARAESSGILLRWVPYVEHRSPSESQQEVA